MKINIDKDYLMLVGITLVLLGLLSIKFGMVPVSKGLLIIGCIICVMCILSE